MESQGDKSPSFASDAELGEIADSFLRQCRAGEAPSVDDLAAKHPRLADRIRALFPSLLFIEQHCARGVGSSASGSSRSAMARPDLRVLGDYRIVREIGRGGMGVVYEAVQGSLGRRVALKVLPFHALLDDKLKERFHREARAAARLHHPAIVPVHDFGEEDGIHYYAMQLIEGRGLHEVIAECRRSRASGSPAPLRAHDAYFTSAARIARRVAEALAAAHAEGILHRDVKPSNLLLDAGGEVWVTDFGLAKAEGTEDITVSGEIIGTLRYMAPESFSGWADRRTDVYGLGITLYELLTLRPAFDDADKSKLFRKISEEAPPLPARWTRRSPGTSRRSC